MGYHITEKDKVIGRDLADLPPSQDAVYRGAFSTLYKYSIVKTDGGPGYVGILVDATNPPDRTTIPAYVFENDVTVVGLAIGTKVQTIGDGAFKYSLPGLGSNIRQKLLTIPDNVTHIGQEAFWGCYQLESLKLGKSLVSIGDYGFYQCGGFRNSITFPSSLVEIGDLAFKGCYQIPSISFSSATSLTTIGDSAFLECGGLTGAIRLKPSITTIGPSAFRGCYSLQSVGVESTSAAIGVDAFRLCGGLTAVYANQPAANWGNNSLSECANIGSGSIYVTPGYASGYDSAWITRVGATSNGQTPTIITVNWL